MAKFEKGKSGNPEGRLPGSPNKITQAVKKKIEDVLNTHFSPESLAKDLKAIEPYERLKLFMRLIEFVVPRMRSTDLKMEFQALSDEDLDRIIQELINASNGTD